MTFEQELTVYSDELLRYAWKFCSNEEDAKDLLQDTYIKALRYKDKFKPGTNLRAWLYTIMRNTFINKYRKGKCADAYRDETKHVLKEQLGSQPTSIDATVSKCEFEALLEKLQDFLEPVFFEALVLCDVQDKSYKQAAAIAKVPLGTIMSRLFRARKYSRAFLLKNYDRDFIVEFVSERKLDEVFDKEVA